MKHKKYLLFSCLGLLAILVSACAGAASNSPAAQQTGNSQNAPIANVAVDNNNTAAQNGVQNGGQPASAPAQNGRQGGHDLTAAAETLGITVEELQQAFQDARPADCAAPSGTTDQSGRPAQSADCRPDLNAVATTLGVTVEELQSALGGPMQGGRQGGPDFTAAAETLGITVEELQQALQDAKPTDCAAPSGTSNQSAQPGKDANCRPDLSAAATALGITVEELQSALGRPPQDGQGGPGNGQPSVGGTSNP